MARIVNISNVDPTTLQFQSYLSEDESLISSNIQEINFNPSEDYIEYFILDLAQNILYSNTAGYPRYSIYNGDVVIDPQLDIESQGYTEGQYYTLYNFLKRKLSSSPSSTFYIQDISTDRTELRLNTTTITNIDVIDLTNQLSFQIENAPVTYLDFYLNFGNNQLLIATNILLDNTNPNDPTVLIKLYEPLPEEFTFNSQCWVVEQIAESLAYSIELTNIFEFDSTRLLNFISGPNFNLNVQDQINNSTPYQNLLTLQSNTSISGSGSLLYQINSILAEKGIEINIDYSDYSQFIHFSSAQTRLENFYYKLSLIEEYTYSGSLSSDSSNQVIWDNKIDELITNFDSYEYYLYYSSESHAWPKTNSTAPYINYSVGSATALSWLNTQLESASFFDHENKDALVNAIPPYLREDSNNDQYMLFVQMIGQHFDNVWVYLKDITNKFDADNRLEFGISKDIVAQAIRDLGVKIYQNNFSSTDLYSALLGLTISGSNINIPFITGSLPTPTGFEYVNTFITASDPNVLAPLDDVNKEIYKRIYHNLPYLLKKKGTPESLRLLSNIYGVPDTIFRINEFSGKSTETTNNWDNFQNQFNYEFFTTSSGYIKVPLLIDTGSGNGRYGAAIYGDSYYGGDSFNEGSSSFSIEFRFKTMGIPTNPSQYNQILAYAPENDFALVLEYTGTGYASGSYSGSIPDPENQYGDLKFIELSSGNVNTLYLPFFDGGWWSVMYNLSDDAIPISNWILDFQPNPGRGVWEDLGDWYDSEEWYDDIFS